MRRVLRTLLVLALAVWLPLFSASALASMIGTAGHPASQAGEAAHALHSHTQHGQAHRHAPADESVSGGQPAQDADGSDACCAQCTVWLVSFPRVLPPAAHDAVEPVFARSMTSFSPDVADRPPLPRRG